MSGEHEGTAMALSAALDLANPVFDRQMHHASEVTIRVGTSSQLGLLQSVSRSGHAEPLTQVLGSFRAS